MTFEVGDRVISTTKDGYSGISGRVVRFEHGEFYVRPDNADGSGDEIPFAEGELGLYQKATPESTFSTDVNDVLTEVGRLLISKNDAYGNSALDPVRIFSQADPVEQLKVRIDDKISRLKSSINNDNDNEDTVLDLVGYLVLLRIATRKQDSE